jgi:hypothetical protein
MTDTMNTTFMVRECEYSGSAYWGGKRCVQGFDGETGRKETAGETQVQMGG